MSVKVEVTEGKRFREGAEGYERSLVPYRDLEIEGTSGKNRMDWPSINLTVWEDGVVEFDIFTGWQPEWDDPLPSSVTFSKKDSPDVVMAILEFLGSL
jgi:hypothetical protein